MKKDIKHIAEEMKRVAKKLGVSAGNLKLGQLLANSNLVEWDVRKLGGLATIKNAYFPVTGKELAEISSSRETAGYIRKLEKQLADKELFESRASKEVGEAIKALKFPRMEIVKPSVSKGKPDMTLEFMLSDIHFGKRTQGENEFNLSICRARIRHAVSVLLREVDQHRQHFNVERVILAVIGDLIESYTMHGLESAIGCEFNNPRQVDEAVESLWYDVVLPIAKLGLPIDFVGVTGNHDRTEMKRTMNKPGLNQLTWIIYKGIERLAASAGLKNIKFHIPEECYHVLDIYGAPCLYEHTDNTNSPDRLSFEKLMQKRSKQVGKQIVFLRGGHWHESMNLDRGRIIINESVPGQDGYSLTMGYNSSAGQTLNFYIRTDVRKTPFYKSFPIALDHITANSK